MSMAPTALGLRFGSPGVLTTLASACSPSGSSAPSGLSLRRVARRPRHSVSKSASRLAHLVCRASGDVDLQGEAIAEDYYSILGLTSEATQEEIRAAYYSCMKACHPDLSNNHPDSVDFCAFVNEVYEVLSDPEMRAVYDEIKGYSLSAVNPFFDTRHERDQAFVDEFTCIGCKNCANTAENTFGIEDLWGRARVCSQNADSVEKVQEAIDTCPVSCIHWVSAPQLALLEDEMRRMERVSVGIMMAGQGSKGGADVFRQASMRWEKRKRTAEDKARVKAARERGKADKWNVPFWAEEGAAESPEDQTGGGAAVRRPSKEKMEKAAEAARRWREYSRAGVDRMRGPLYLPDAAEKKGSPEDEGKVLVAAE